MYVFPLFPKGISNLSRPREVSESRKSVGMHVFFDYAEHESENIKTNLNLVEFFPKLINHNEECSP